MPTPTVINKWRYSDAIPRIFWDENYIFENWENNPIAAKVGGGASSGTAGDTNVLQSRFNSFEYNIKGTQTITAPSIVSVSQGVSGLNIGMDQTDNDGVELTNGILSSSPVAFKVGTDRAFFFRVRFSIAVVAGTDDCAVGFRECEAYQANVDDYTDAAMLNVISGNIFIETILNNAATVSTDTTNNWANAETHTLEVLVDALGVVTYKIDGVAPLVTAAYTFTSGLFVVPYMFFLNTASLAGQVNILEWECGYQS